MTSINPPLGGKDVAARARLAGLTVNDVLRAAPGAGTVFNCFGIDTCCGGALPLGEVTTRHRLDLTAILDELNQGSSGSCCIR